MKRILKSEPAAPLSQSQPRSKRLCPTSRQPPSHCRQQSPLPYTTATTLTATTKSLLSSLPPPTTTSPSTASTLSLSSSSSILVTITTHFGSDCALRVHRLASVATLFSQVSLALNNLPRNSFHLQALGKELSDPWRCITDYGITDNTVVKLTISFTNWRNLLDRRPHNAMKAELCRSHIQDCSTRIKRFINTKAKLRSLLARILLVLPALSKSISKLSPDWRTQQSSLAPDPGHLCDGVTVVSSLTKKRKRASTPNSNDNAPAAAGSADNCPSVGLRRMQRYRLLAAKAKDVQAEIRRIDTEVKNQKSRLESFLRQVT